LRCQFIKCRCLYKNVCKLLSKNENDEQLQAQKAKLSAQGQKLSAELKTFENNLILQQEQKESGNSLK